MNGEAAVAEAGESLDIAGFWRRTIAFIIDGLILGITGMVAGWLMFDTLAGMGAYARLAGFAVALSYFGIFNSRLVKGQTIGKMAMSLRVVAADGKPITVARSFARYAVLGVPFFLNNLPLGMPTMLSWVGYALSVVVFGVGLSIIYLYIFNRRTRQSLHDLLVGSYVIRVDRTETGRLLVPIWHGHWVVVGLVLAISLAGPAAAGRLIGSPFFADLMPAYNAVAAQPHVRSVSLTKNASWVNGVTSHYLISTLTLDAAMVHDKAFAENAAHIVAANFPAYGSEDAVVIKLKYGYDMGIASAWTTQTFAFKPAQLQ